MKRFTKTYYHDNFRVRVWVSDTSDRLTIYENKEYGLGLRLVYELYSSRYRHYLIGNMVKDMSRVKLPNHLMMEVLNDVNNNLKNQLV